MSDCPTCAGCGKVANDEDRTPWKHWLELPLESCAAVIMGLVRAEDCPDCGGTGNVPEVKSYGSPRKATQTRLKAR